ncbi:hypothetical protein BTHE_1935 [Bifidobacterium thermophilum]|nr:hypothetical protein BTHE_1935 [Bifidobacterium thermophilum]
MRIVNNAIVCTECGGGCDHDCGCEGCVRPRQPLVQGRPTCRRTLYHIPPRRSRARAGRRIFLVFHASSRIMRRTPRHTCMMRRVAV